MGTEEEFWAIVGLLHDLDFERWPEEHCVKSQELMRQAGVEEEHRPGHRQPRLGPLCGHQAGARDGEGPLRGGRAHRADRGGRPDAPLQKRVQDMELKSLKKKFKDKKFAAGCSRDVIAQGAELLGWELDQLLDRTLAGHAGGGGGH